LAELARTTDPAESHRAAEQIIADGTRNRMMQVAYNLLKKYPGYTANELEQVSGLIDGKIRKRLNDLRKMGLAETRGVRVSRVTGKLNACWYAI
jgi:hypothetical protein